MSTPSSAHTFVLLSEIDSCQGCWEGVSLDDDCCVPLKSLAQTVHASAFKLEIDFSHSAYQWLTGEMALDRIKEVQEQLTTTADSVDIDTRGAHDTIEYSRDKWAESVANSMNRLIDVVSSATAIHAIWAGCPLDVPDVEVEREVHDSKTVGQDGRGSLVLYGALKRIIERGGEVQLLSQPSKISKIAKWASLLGKSCSFIAARNPPSALDSWFIMSTMPVWTGSIRFCAAVELAGIRLLPISLSCENGYKHMPGMEYTTIDVLHVCSIGDVLPIGATSSATLVVHAIPRPSPSAFEVLQSLIRVPHLALVVQAMKQSGTVSPGPLYILHAADVDGVRQVIGRIFNSDWAPEKLIAGVQGLMHSLSRRERRPQGESLADNDDFPTPRQIFAELPHFNPSGVTCSFPSMTEVNVAPTNSALDTVRELREYRGLSLAEQVSKLADTAASSAVTTADRLLKGRQQNSGKQSPKDSSQLGQSSQGVSFSRHNSYESLNGSAAAISSPQSTSSQRRARSTSSEVIFRSHRQLIHDDPSRRENKKSRLDRRSSSLASTDRDETDLHREAAIRNLIDSRIPKSLRASKSKATAIVDQLYVACDVLTKGLPIAALNSEIPRIVDQNIGIVAKSHQK